MAKFSLGIDIGGTFTDIVAYDHSAGRQFNRKILTSYDDPSRAVMEGIDALSLVAESSVQLGENNFITLLKHL